MDREELDNLCEKGILGLVLAILVYSPLAFGAVSQGGFAWFGVVEWLTAAILLLWGVRFYINPKHRLLWPWVCWGVLLFVAYAIGRYLTADVEFLAREELIKVLVYAIIFFAIVNNLHKQETTQIVGLTLIFLAALLSVFAIYQFLTGYDYVWGIEKPEGYRKRGSGTFICPNNLAGYLEMILPLALAFTLTGRFVYLMKIFLGYATLLIFAGISVTVSRGGWLAAGISLFVMFFWLIRSRDYYKRALAALGILIGVFLLFYWKAEMPPERHERFEVARQVEDVRFQLWQPAVAMWKDHMMFGVGPAHFDYRFRQYRPAAQDLQHRPDRVHNDYLNTLTDWGLVGAVLVLLCWVLFYYQVFAGWKFVQRTQNDLAAKRSNKAAFVSGGAIGLLAILVHSFVDFNMHIPANAILAVTMMALVSSHCRFASERYWHTVRLPLRIPITLCLLASLVYLLPQAWKASAEGYHLSKANKGDANPDTQIAHLKRAWQSEDKNFETAHRIGELYRLQSWEGGENYKELAQEAIQWFNRSIDLNPFNPHPVIQQGMCLHWLGEPEKATAYFKKAEQLDPNSYNTEAYLGWHYFQLEDYVTAKRSFARSQALLADTERNTLPSSYTGLIEQKLKEQSEPK